MWKGVSFTLKFKEEPDMKENKMNRRNFLKLAGNSAVAAATISACGKAPAGIVSSEEKIAGDMTYRQGPDGDKISLLGYGCMRWPTIKDEGGNEIIDQDAVNELVDYAIEHGVTYFDTAPMYVQALSEKATGIALKRHPRESFFLATKLSNHQTAHDFQTAINMYRTSFERLQTDHIDYYLLHNLSGTPELVIERFIDNGVIDFLLKEKEAGRIRHLGFSFHGNRALMDYLMELHTKYHWDFAQIQMNYVDWIDDAEYFYESLAKNNIPVIIMEPILGGRLASVNGHATEQLRSLRPKESTASWAFRFCGSKPQVMTVLSGMTYMEHLKDNLKTFSPLEELSEIESATLEDVAHQVHDFPAIPCTGCQYCMPCPYGIDIPGNFRHYNKCLNEGNVENDNRNPEYRKARRAYLVSLDRNVELLRQAERCIGCGKCAPHCPQGIEIPKQLRRIATITDKLRRSLIETN